MTPESSGTRLDVTAGLPRTLYAADVGVCLLFLAALLLTWYLKSNPIQFWLAVWVPPLFLWITRRLRRELPKLEAFIKENLLI